MQLEMVKVATDDPDALIISKDKLKACIFIENLIF